MDAVRSFDYGAFLMVVQNITATPFGVKRIYSVDGECVWSEYLQWAPLKRREATPVRCEGMPVRSQQTSNNGVFQFMSRYRANAVFLA